MAGEEVELVERVRVEEVLDALAGEQLALGVLTLDGARRPGVERLLTPPAQVLDLVLHRDSTLLRRRWATAGTADGHHLVVAGRLVRPPCASLHGSSVADIVRSGRCRGPTGQRGWKRQPVGGSWGSGGSPSIGRASADELITVPGTASRRTFVNGCWGVASTSSVRPISTICPSAPSGRRRVAPVTVAIRQSISADWSATTCRPQCICRAERRRWGTDDHGRC